MTLKDALNQLPNTDKNVLVSCSGGLDSSILTMLLVEKYGPNKVVALSYDYNQKQKVELQKAAALCKKLGIQHQILDLSILGEIARPMCANIGGTEVEMPTIVDVLGSPQPPTYVPFRNMILLSLTMSAAEVAKASHVFTGLQVHDVYGYWDTSQEFVDAMNKVASQNRTHKVEITAPFSHLSKTEELMLCQEMGKLDLLKHTITCYNPNENGESCGVCPSCIAEEQRVLMADGVMKNIEDVEIGERIITFDEYTNKFTVATIENKFYQGKKTVHKLESIDEKNYLWLTDDHLLKIKASSGGPKWKEFKTLKNPSARYNTYFLDPRFYPDDIEQYTLGYLRGLIDGDGHISRGVCFYQKEISLVEEFVKLYNKYIQPTKMTIKQKTTNYGYDMNFVDGGYGKIFDEKTQFRDDKDYMLGYLNGIIITDGCVTYNKNNHVVNLLFSQAINPNLYVIENVEKCFNKLEIKYNKIYKHPIGKESFKEDGCEMYELSIRKVWRIPFIYGTEKKEKILRLFEEKTSLNNLEKKFIKKFNRNEFKEDIKVYDLKTTAGTFICEGFLVHNCSERIKGFQNLKLVDPAPYSINIKW